MIETLLTTCALIKWCGAKDDQNTIEVQYQLMQTQLGGIELNMKKSRMAAAMNQDKLENYEQLYHKVEYNNDLKFKEVKRLQFRVRNAYQYFYTKGYGPETKSGSVRENFTSDSLAKKHEADQGADLCVRAWTEQQGKN